ncbi:hypothetical protein [Kurthia sp. Dielmo]|uniref:hypothetical protein n=1 Tax=Kurthia sp. Dielmo TaxID=1033738 RepID=UPI0011224867|nr:hypothetical protein [Kurthia sp. Dielmo]
MSSLLEKTRKPVAQRLKTLDLLATNLNKKHGKVLVGRIGKTPEIRNKLTVKFLPTPSIEINEAFGGGFPKGRTSIVAGLPDSGK